jgi:hypothetical protein
MDEIEVQNISNTSIQIENGKEELLSEIFITFRRRWFFYIYRNVFKIGEFH